MAYNRKYNPDALPAHAEPDQAAQMLYSSHGRSESNPAPATPTAPPLSSSPASNSYLHKPNPPLPQDGRPQQGYSRPSNPPSRSPAYTNSAYPPPQQPQPQGYGGHNAHQGYGATTPPNQHGVYGAPSPRLPGAYPTPQAAAGVAPPDGSLFTLFRAVDTRGTGQLSEVELGKALKNGDYTSFDPMTVKMMIRMFDHDRSGTVGFDEFTGLWGFLAAWRSLFDRFDEDRSSSISYEEFSKALLAFGYHLSAHFVQTMFRLYDRPGPNAMSFDLFVQSCISLKRMTDVFKRYDTDRDGFITLSFEEFLVEILNQR